MLGLQLHLVTQAPFPWQGSDLWRGKPGQCIEKQRHHSANKSPYRQDYDLLIVTYECWTVKKVKPCRIDAFELSCWRRLLRVPWTARRSNQSILREINSEYSLEGLMLKLKFQYFGHLMQTAESLEKSLMLKKIEDRRRRGHQRIRWLDGITDAMDMNLGKPREMVRDREAWHAAVHDMAKWTRLDDWTTTAHKFIISRSQYKRISLRRYALGKQMFIS